MLGRVQVLGPAYLDRVLRVDSPLLAPESPPLDQSVGGRLGFGGGDALTLADPAGGALTIDLPAGWPGPRGVVELDRPIGVGPGATRRLRAESWDDDLGGMGAGFAAATGGELVTVLGPADESIGAAVETLLGREGIAARIVRRDGPSDWTLLISSGPHGDKLAVGFRDGHDAPTAADLASHLAEPCDLRIVAGLPNRLAAGLLKAPGARLRVFAPAMRNAIDRDDPILRLIAPVDVLCCNRGEWEATADREEVAARLSILVVTDGAAGSEARFTDPVGASKLVRIPAFPRTCPPRDTNRAGEAFAACFLATLLARGWRPEDCTADVELVRGAMTRASAASALVLDMTRFGFPTPARIDAAATRGVVD
jgi:ribokinase